MEFQNQKQNQGVKPIEVVQAEQYRPNGDRTFNQFTRSHYDICEYENELRIGSKPIKYFVNQLNTPQSNPFIEFTGVGNQQVYNVQNNYQAPLPSRLNDIGQTYVFPHSTTPFLGQANESILYSNTSNNLRFGSNIREKKSSVDTASIEYNRWDIVDAQTIQNAGQFGGVSQANGQGVGRDGFFDYKAQNNVLFMNSAVPYFGISTRDQLHNFVETSGC